MTVSKILMYQVEYIYQAYMVQTSEIKDILLLRPPIHQLMSGQTADLTQLKRRSVFLRKRELSYLAELAHSDCWAIRGPN